MAFTRLNAWARRRYLDSAEAAALHDKAKKLARRVEESRGGWPEDDDFASVVDYALTGALEAPEAEASSTTESVDNGTRDERLREMIIRIRDEAAVAADNPTATSSDVAVWLDRRLERLLEVAGVETITAAGRVDFDMHEVEMTRPTTDADDDGRIAETIRHGYIHGGEVLRPAKVVAFRLEDAAAAGPGAG